MKRTYYTLARNVVFLLACGFLIAAGTRLGQWVIPQPRIHVDVDCRPDMGDDVPEHQLPEKAPL